MQTTLTKFGLGILALVAASSAHGDVKWESSFSAAMTKAKLANKLVMVEFFATWDKHSSDLNQQTFSDPTAAKVAGKFVAVKLDIEKDGKALGTKYHITNYPSVLFLDRNENPVGLIDGFEPPEEFVKHGNTFLKDYRDLPGLQASYRRNPQGLDDITKIGVIYADRYQMDPALAKLSEAEAIDPSNKTDKLSDLYNAVGDYYQNASRFDPAIKYFEKAAKTSKVTDKRAYGYLSIVSCYFSMADPTTDTTGQLTQAKAIAYLKAASPYLNAALKLPLKADDRKTADNYRMLLQSALGPGS